MQLIAKSGDLSASGMDNIATIIDVSEDQAALINEFQALNNVLFYAVDNNYPDDTKKFLFIRMVNLQEKLVEAGVYKNKYYTRTTWTTHHE